MNMNKSIFTLFFVLLSQLLLLSSCESSKPREVVIDNKFKMQLPGYVSDQKRLNEEASLMYANLLREVYVMVIEDSFEEMNNAIIENDLVDDYSLDFDGFCKLVANNETDAFLVKDDISKLKSTTINRMSSRFYEGTRNITGADIYYKIALVKGKETYYQVVAWTLASRADRYGEVLGEMIYSFEELNAQD
jgi:hypothetical protein